MHYVEYHENYSKCNQGGLDSVNLKPKVCRAYENTVNADRCMVQLMEKYISLRPADFRCSNAFYSRPLAKPSNPNVWYSCQPQGRHMLENVVRKMCREIGLTGRRTNHSLRGTTATRMFGYGCNEQLIQKRTGHRSVAVRNYKRTTPKQLCEVSNILYDNVTDKGQLECKKPCTATKSSEERDNIVIERSSVDVSQVNKLGGLLGEVSAKGNSDSARKVVFNFSFNVSK